MKKKTLKSVMGVAFVALFAFSMFGNFNVDESSDITLAGLLTAVEAQAEDGGGNGRDGQCRICFNYNDNRVHIICYSTTNPLRSCSFSPCLVGLC